MAVLTVPADSVWQEWPVSGEKTIYDRACYSLIWQKCQGSWQSNCRLVLVKGNPGIGKSYFLDYALSRLLAAGKRVMVILGPRDKVFLYKGNGHSEQPEEISSLRDAKANNRANDVDYVLYDPHENPLETQQLDMTFFCGRNILIAMSPDPQNCSKIIKGAKQKQQLYMGPTDFEEAEAMRTSCYSSAVSAEELRKRFDEAGGVPRFLMEQRAPFPPAAFQDSVMKDISDLQNSLNDLAVSPRRIDSGSVASQFKSIWGLYHLVPDGSFTNYQIEVCCDNALKLLRQRLLEMEVEKLWNLYENTDEKMGTIRGICFEAYAHKKIIVHGINLTAKKMNQNEISTSVTTSVVVPPGGKTFRLPDNNVETLATQRPEIHQNGGGYMLPNLPNYPVLDSSFVTPTNSCFMFQMKAGKGKPLSSLTTTVTAALGNTFVVITPREGIVTKKLAGSPPGMNQFVLVLQESVSL